MNSTILYTAANDINGSLITAREAEKGKKFSCPVCEGEMILRKSGNTGKGSKRPHFAHKALTQNCTPETALHYSFKMLLAKKIDEAISENHEIKFSWDCEYCGVEHSGNLLKKARSVSVEHHLGSCQPDIALLDAEENVYVAIEVVVTHSPEDKTLQFYEENGIVLIQINLSSDEDLNILEDRISRPDIVKLCTNPKCADCGEYKEKKTMTIVDGPCSRCAEEMKVAAISIEKNSEVGDTWIYPSKFSDDEIKLARSFGVFLRDNYSRTRQVTYLANTCKMCYAFCGDSFIAQEYLRPAGYGEFEFQKVDAGYYCVKCEDAI